MMQTGQERPALQCFLYFPYHSSHEPPRALTDCLPDRWKRSVEVHEIAGEEIEQEVCHSIVVLHPFLVV
jgi:hypothetical protein